MLRYGPGLTDQRRMKRDRVGPTPEGVGVQPHLTNRIFCNLNYKIVVP